MLVDHRLGEGGEMDRIPGCPPWSEVKPPEQQSQQVVMVSPINATFFDKKDTIQQHFSSTNPPVKVCKRSKLTSGTVMDPQTMRPGDAMVSALPCVWCDRGPSRCSTLRQQMKEGWACFWAGGLHM